MMSDDDMELYAMFINLQNQYLNLRKMSLSRRWKVRPINRDRTTAGYYRNVFLKMKDMDNEQLFVHTRMTRPLFDLLENLLSDHLIKEKQQIFPEERISITLLYLAFGTSVQTIAWAYKMGVSTVRHIIYETCDVIWKVLSPVYVTEPTESQYKDIADDFFNMWNMPNCVGAIDGKHIAIKCPPKSGSLYYNYKKHFSIVLMAACDTKYKFTSVAVGSYGSQSDGGVFNSTRFGQSVILNELPLPPNVPLKGTRNNSPFPHYFVGDAAFPLRKNLMRPYPGANLTEVKQIFNYRLSRARRIIENSFGILVARWRVLRTTMECLPENCEKIVLACIALHNFIMCSQDRDKYCPQNYVDSDTENGNWRSELFEVNGPLRSITLFSRNASQNAFQIRDYLADYFVNEGAIPFQSIITHQIYGD